MLLCIVSLILRWTLLDTTASYSRAEATLNGGKGESLKSRCWKSAEKSESSLNQFNQFRSLALHRKTLLMIFRLSFLNRKSDAMEHFVSDSCEGEVCSMCADPATHKVGEEIPSDDPELMRHNYTAYVCCKHFRAIFGSAVPCANHVTI